MGKINKEEQARLEGMAFALKIAKEQGIEALENECKFRNATRIPIAVSRKAADECINKIKMNTIDTVTILAAMTLHDEFGFGKERIARFMNRFNFKAECIMEDYTTWDEQIQILADECKLELSIRKNDKDVRC